MMSLKGRVAIITGASTGIGESIAEYFAKEGASLAICARNKNNLEAVAEKCRQISTQDVLVIVGDLTSASTREELVKRTKETFNKIDILVNNAGLIHPSKLLDLQEKEIDDQINLNLKVPVLLSVLAGPHLIESKGCVINISSAASMRHAGENGMYSVTKSALDKYTQVLALELGEKGVRVNSINPGFVQTAMLTHYTPADQRDKMNEVYGSKNPLRRIGTPDEIAHLAVFLASDRASYMTGSLVVADGGLCVTTTY